MSTSLYTTFGNEVKYRITQDTLEAYLENATIRFPLPEASSEILSEITVDQVIDPVQLDVVRSRLVSIGFKPANATTMAKVLIEVGKSQNVNPLDYFSLNEASLKLAVDTYKTINMLRPPGNRIGLAVQRENNKSRYSNLIKP